MKELKHYKCSSLYKNLKKKIIIILLRLENINR